MCLYRVLAARRTFGQDFHALGTDSRRSVFSFLPNVVRLALFANVQQFSRSQFQRSLFALNALKDTCDERCHADELCYKAIRRALINFFRRRVLLQFSHRHDRNHIGHGERFGLIMRYIYRCNSKLLLEITQPDARILADLRIKIGEWLVEK